MCSEELETRSVKKIGEPEESAEGLEKAVFQAADEEAVASEPEIVFDSGFVEEYNEHEGIGENGLTRVLRDDIAQLDDKLAALEKLFETKILHSTHEEKIVDQMHKELQKYKDDMYSQLVRPILLDIIEIRDSILRVARVHQNKPVEERSVPIATFEMYAFDIQEILEKNSIEIFKSDEKTDFIPVRHRGIKKIPTLDKSLHSKIAESLSYGYNYQGRAISAEKVAIYFYEPQTEQAKSNDMEEE